MTEPELLSPSPEAELIDGKAPCPQCGVYYKVSASGTLRKHNCPGVIVVDQSRTTTRRSTTPKNRQAPDKVRKVGTALLASGVETGTAFLISQTVPCKMWQIPAQVKELPDAEGMIAPLINAVWPTLPKGAQKVLSNIAEQEDLIAAAFLWGEWFTTLKRWTAQAREELRTERRALQQQAPAYPTREATTDGIPIRSADGQQDNGRHVGLVTGLQPFEPAGAEAL